MSTRSWREVALGKHGTWVVSPRSNLAIHEAMILYNDGRIELAQQRREGEVFALMAFHRTAAIERPAAHRFSASQIARARAFA